jgi:hypothetical protein
LSCLNSFIERLAAAAHPPAPSLAGASEESGRCEVRESAMASVVLSFTG